MNMYLNYKTKTLEIKETIVIFYKYNKQYNIC